MNKSLQDIRLTLLNVSKVKLDKKWHFDNVISPFARLYLVTDGSAVVSHNNQTFELKKGHLYLIPPFTFSRYACDDNMEQYFVHFLEETGNGLSIFNIKKIAFEIEANALDELLFERLLNINPQRGLIQDDPKAYDTRTTMLKFAELNNNMQAPYFIETQGILQILLSRFIKNEASVLDNNSPPDHKISTIVAYIHEHLAEPLTVNDLAKQVHLNVDYFSRLFQNQIGVRPVTYIMTKRIERAQLLLSTTDYSLQNIADMTGLPNISYFSRVFTRLTNKTPAAYRKENWGS